MVLPFLASGDPPRRLRVLVADDDCDTTESLAELLGLVGCDVEVAFEGFAVAPVAARFRPDACVLDVRLPGIDGWEIARRLRAGPGGGRLLLIAVTGVADANSAAIALAAGFDHYFRKPAAPSVVIAALSQFAGRSRVRTPCGV